MVDAEDYSTLSTHKWHYNEGYAARVVWENKKYRRIYMQNELLGVRKGVDHIDRDRLNNRRSNLRIASRGLNGYNSVRSSRDLPRGVSYHKQSGRYIAQMGSKANHVYIGIFETPEEAGLAYRAAAFNRFGEYPPE